MNKIMLVGNLTRNPEFKTNHTSETGYTLFGLAVNRGADKNGEKITDFFDCIACGKLGEAIVRYSKKGQKIAVSGQISTRNVQGEDGKTRRYYSVIVNDCEFCSPREKEETAAAAKTQKKTPVAEPWDDSDCCPF